MQDEKIQIVKNSLYTRYYYKNQLHNESGPAIKYDNGSERWYQKGRLHRVDGPAVVNPDIQMIWYQRGKIHRLNGPAIIVLPTKVWVYGRQVQRSDGYEEWYYSGKKHRIDGPAVTWDHGHHEYWLFNIKYETKFEYDVAIEMYRQNNAKKYAIIQEKRLKKQLTVI